ncbi:thiamine pyrophosphate-binding protein [Phytohabitans suffuscus]|uniref:Acetolactate synthase I/II/III large subunit n=1 Tax=Phytohabitans suffuscus TaxID=624315 RepID=A0A6F8YEG9_9ACTN|nr:thiamine pyrophosphate-binding protein [Phytohabitans suffuscus]BCB84534.1 acetolactate synthase I/II/III large subunit [Phytohabitans suffuscus]
MTVAEGGDLLIGSLADHGVDRLFSVSGGPVNSAYMATRGGDVRLLHVRHESAAGFMADATARLTAVPGVALVTLGPGVTNMVTPALSAQMAGVPMLVVGGQAPTDTVDRGAAMSVDGVPIMAPVTDWSARVPQVSRIPEYVDRAWRHMWAGQPGPVFLEIPVDVLSAPVPRPSRRAVATVRRPALAAGDLDEVAKALAAACRPVLIAGDGVRWASAGPLLTAAATHHALPYALARMARGIDESHELCFGPAYEPCNPALVQALAECDLVLLVGHTFDFDLRYGDTTAAAATVVQVHEDAAQLGRNRRADIALGADAASFLAALAQLTPATPDRQWTGAIIAAWHDHRATVGHEARTYRPGIHPVDLVERVTAALPPETTYVTSHGNIDFWADAHLRPTDTTRYLRAGQSGALGAEIPFGVAASLVRPGEPVVVFVGDGGFGYHCLELETAARYGATPVVVIADDEKWGAIALPQQRLYGDEVAMDLPRRDWAALVRAIGGHGESVTDRAEIGPAIGRAVKSGLPAVVHVPVASVESHYMRLA